MKESAHYSGLDSSDCVRCEISLRAGSDHNLFWSPNGAPIRFTDDGLSLAEWQAQNRTAGPADRGSAVGDPLFVDPDRGEYSLKSGSPAIGLGSMPIPPIHASYRIVSWK